MTLLTTDDQLITICQIMLQKKKLQSTIFSMIVAAQSISKN